MTEIASWAETPAALVAGGGYFPEDRAVELAAREAERARDRADFEARLASNPEWSAARKLQEALAARGWTGQWIEVGHSRPAELEPLFTAQQAALTRKATYADDGHGGLEPSNDIARQIEEHAQQRYEAARLRLAAENQHLPPGSPR